jgi:hypothetical protein
MNESTHPAPRTRPTLLTVLCILSFIGGAWSLVSSGMSMTNPMGDVEKLEAQMEEAMDQMGSDGPVARMLESTMETALRAAEMAVPIGATNMGLAVISLLGVWMMWNLRKMGFYLYTLASIAALAVPLYFLGGGLIAMLSIGLGGFISLVFIILYALNLKHMS